MVSGSVLPSISRGSVLPLQTLVLGLLTSFAVVSGEVDSLGNIVDEELVAEQGPFFSRLHRPLRMRERIEALPQGPVEPYGYDRVLPFFGRELADRGYALPLPLGVSVMINSSLQPQDISNSAVALIKGSVPPPPDTPLRELPSVRYTGVEADTLSAQLKVDAWVLPFLNVYGILGYFESDVDLVVEVDLDEAFPPPICGPVQPCGTVSKPFKAEADGYSYGLGFTGAYGVEPWFGALSVSYVYNDGRKGDDKIKTFSVSGRSGRYWNVSDGLLLSAYLGVDYLNVSQTVNGVTEVPNAFPDGDDLNVRYRIDQDNVDKLAGVIGMSFGLREGIGVVAEAAFGEDSHRYMASAYYRY